jgi:hypothetical protein
MYREHLAAARFSLSCRGVVKHLAREARDCLKLALIPSPLGLGPAGTLGSAAPTVDPQPRVALPGSQ